MVTLNVGFVSANFAKQYLKNNPQATEQDLQVGLRNHLQELKKNGVKISDKQIAQANATVGDLYKVASAEIKASLATQATPKTGEVVSELNSRQARVSYPAYNAHLEADHHYDEISKMGKRARKRLHNRNMADARAAFAGEEYMNYLKEHNPKLYKEELEAQKSLETPSNNQNKKVANADYQSSKKRKTAKKEAERNSQIEHNSSRNNKINRNKKYCTSQGIMTKPAKRKFQAVSESLNGNINVSIHEEPNPILKQMKEFYQKLETVAKTQKEVSTEAIETAVKETKGKGKIGWIAGFGSVVLALTGILLATKKEPPKDEQLKDDLNEVA